LSRRCSVFIAALASSCGIHAHGFADGQAFLFGQVQHEGETFSDYHYRQAAADVSQAGVIGVAVGK